MTRPRGKAVRAANAIKQPIRQTRSPQFPNPTSKHGTLVHRFGTPGWPVCGVRMKSVIYTSEPINCRKCIEMGEQADQD